MINGSLIEPAIAKIVGLGGRGVLVPGKVILTACHCVNWTGKVRVTRGDFFLEERVKTAQGMGMRVRVLAVEPASDIAALGSKNEQELAMGVDRFRTFCSATVPVRVCVNDLPLREEFTIYLQDMESRWRSVRAELTEPDSPVIWVKGKTCKSISGGPILSEKGELVALVASGTRAKSAKDYGLAPRPLLSLPAWLSQRILAAQNRL